MRVNENKQKNKHLRETVSGLLKVFAIHFQEPVACGVYIFFSPWRKHRSEKSPEGAGIPVQEREPLPAPRELITASYIPVREIYAYSTQKV